MTLQRTALYLLASLLLNASLSFGQPTIKLIAGGNGLAPIGDGGPAVSAFIGQAGNITVDATGNLYIWDATDSRIRKVNTAGIISSVTATVGQLKEIEGITHSARRTNNAVPRKLLGIAASTTNNKTPWPPNQATGCSSSPLQWTISPKSP